MPDANELGKKLTPSSSPAAGDQPNESAPAAQSSAPNEPRTKLNVFLRDYLRPFVFVALVLCTVRSTIADWNDVPTGSMNPSILEGDRIFVNKLAYDLKVPFTTWHVAEWSQPKRGDVVVFFSPADDTRLVKRVVGLPGDTVELRDNHLFINGEEADYGPADARFPAAMLNHPGTSGGVFASESVGGMKHPIMRLPQIYNSLRNYGPNVIPADHYFMMGDNRDNSGDSRVFGFVERSRIVGRASAVAISLDPDHSYLPRWHRFFTPLP
jgi:signal peptidase I